MSFTKFDNIIRSAIWNSYDCNCFYCNQSLNWNDLNIDHIIPEYLSNDLQAFEKVKRDYELDSNFQLNALYNLVPSHSKCNLKKGNELFEKTTTLFFLGLAQKNKSKIEKEIEKLKNRKHKGLTISRLEAALSANIIDLRELDTILAKLKEDNWRNTEIKLPEGIEFIDEVYDIFYLNLDCSVLYDKKLILGKSIVGLELVNDKNVIRIVSTLREWKRAIEEGFYPLTTLSIKMASYFSFLDELLFALRRAQMPKVSFISEPWIGLKDFDYLSLNVIANKGLIEFEDSNSQYDNNNISIGELIRNEVITLETSEIYPVALVYNNSITYLSEQFRADFNNDGVEDIFVKGYFRLKEGSFACGFTDILTRYSNNHLIEPASFLNVMKLSY